MLTQIVCIGNGFQEGDDLGPRVLDWLSARRLPEDVELVDGGLRGLDLLGCVERADRVVFVDAVSGGEAPTPGRVVELRGEARQLHAEQSFGHGAGLSYLLRVLPWACQGPPPEWVVVGTEPPFCDSTVQAVAERVLALAASDRLQDAP